MHQLKRYFFCKAVWYMLYIYSVTKVFVNTEYNNSHFLQEPRSLIYTSFTGSYD